ncbi:MAG TPA: MarR family winged helix-turn-helix transcriptional regulator [Flavobacteriaceae bacterium]|nr:MarR family winged helix-turn-helix transcriptional regulator [Flavobacteriaceae bacterium]
MTTRIKSEDIIHLLTGRTPLSLSRIFGIRLREADIAVTKEQWSVLAVLWKKDGVTQQYLADATFRDRAGITRLLDNLQKEGLIERRPDKDDRRTNCIYLTQKGKAIEKNVVEVLDEVVNAITVNVPDEDIERLRDIFEQINHNIQKLEIR